MARVPNPSGGLSAQERSKATDIVNGWGAPIRFGAKGANEYIPTWQRGMDQLPPFNIGNYADEGYRNSIIYACINERATSLASLPFRLGIPDAEGETDIPSHQLLDLLASPSSAMDGFEFMELLCTHLDGAGNVYVEKDRRPSPDFPDRRTWPVKQLGLIRPDYVEIIPGKARNDDRFVVKVNGQIIKVLPRKDVIHITTPNPANDFYGLSPIAVIAREADLDSLMTDFDVSFFRNAGVPMGILKTKTRHSPDETQQIRSEFRRRFSGVKRWFEVLILNSDEAEYQALGSKPDEMEMAGTRAFAEARVCSVYGVPPIIVGVLVGLQNSPWSNYENAQFSFWSETMIPLGMRITSALNRELVPEFRAAATSRAVLRLDTSDIKALQEDNTQRLQAVGVMVATGGFTVNEALQLHGLPILDNGDFYVRSLTQVIDVALPQRSRQQIGLAPTVVEPVAAALHGDVRAKRFDPAEIMARVRASREPLVTRAQNDIETFLAGQLHRVLSRVKAGELPIDEDALLEEVLRPHFTAGAQAGWGMASELIGLSGEFDPADPAVIRLLRQASANVTGINETTRSALNAILEQSRNEGWAISQTRDAINAMAEFGASRAETIARTELARADNLGATERYQSSGLVDEVQVIDGPSCGWTDHDDPDTADGSIRTIADAQAYPAAHPRCVRSIVPIIRGG